MELKPGYQQTEVGVIPVDWDVASLGELNPFVTSGSRGWAAFYANYGDLFVRITNMSRKTIYLDLNSSKFVRVPQRSTEGVRTQLQEHDVLISITADIGIVSYVDRVVPLPAFINQHIALVRFNQNQANGKFVSYFLAADAAQQKFLSSTDNGAKAGMSLGGVTKIQIARPPLPEQSAIATALSDVDALLAAQDALIEKKRAIRQGAMRELLTGRRRLPGFSGKWVVRTLVDSANCLDNLRVPLNEGQRAKMQGDYPYCGANGVLDYVNDFVIDDDIILMAEDGGYFDEYELRPIAYQMSGKCWINNHAHILKAKVGFDQGFLFYSLVHKNILPFLASGTRAKLNKSELFKIEVLFPPTKEEQFAIAHALCDLDAEINTLEARREKTAQLKHGMMQALLTGRIRLVSPVVQQTESSTNVIPFKKKGRDSQSEALTITEAGGKQANVHFKRSVFAAEIVDQLHNEPTFGHVKFEKLIFLAEHLCRVDTGSNYHRDAAGPYDNRALRSIDSQMKKQKWFDAQKLDGRYQYVPLDKRGGHKEYFDRYYADIRTRLDEIIATFRTAKTDQCEIVATLYGAWADLIYLDKPVTDDAILDQVLNHWHDKKKEIPEGRWRKALEWIREKGYVPEGASTA